MRRLTLVLILILIFLQLNFITDAAFSRGRSQASAFSEQGREAIRDFGPMIQATDLDEPLKAGETYQRSIKSDGPPHRFSIQLHHNQVLRVNVKENHIDAQVRIFLSEKDVLPQMNLGYGYGRERGTVIVEQAGKYTVVVSASARFSEGNYRLIATVKEDATESDKKDVEAQSALDEGFKGKPEEAIKKWEKAKSIWLEIGDAYWAGFTGNLLGVISQALGRPKDAFAFYQQAWSLMKNADDTSGEAQILANMAQLYSSRGDKPRARSFYRQSLAIDDQIGDPGRSGTLLNIGYVMSDLGYPEEALSYFEKAIPLADETNNELEKGMIFIGMGRAVENMGKVQDALNYYQDKALPTFKSMRQTRGAVKGQATALTDIGAVLYALGDRKSAATNFTLARDLFEQISDPIGMGACYRNLASIYADRKQYPEALDYLKNKALPLFTKSEDIVDEAITFDAIGSVYLDQNKAQEALDYFKDKALPAWLSTDDIDGQALTRNNIGNAYYRLGDRQTARKFLKDALTLYLEVGNQFGAGSDS